jgi:hypothetical protein
MDCGHEDTAQVARTDRFSLGGVARIPIQKSERQIEIAGRGG